MKKLVILTLIALTLLSCSNDTCSNRCGTVIDTSIIRNAPATGDEIYEITFETECGEIIVEEIPFDAAYQNPGSPYQPVPSYQIGDDFCK